MFLYSYLCQLEKKGNFHITIEESYELEYGKATIEIHSDALNSNDNVLIIDDLIATISISQKIGSFNSWYY